MKLNVRFDLLWAKVHEMGADKAEFELGSVWVDSDLEFDKELSDRGIEISLEDLESESGLLTVRGRQVLLFIPDQGHRITEVLKNPETGKKFHVADCRTLEAMKAKKRFERYRVTNNLTGDFQVYGTDYSTGNNVEGLAKLNVCQNCLTYLNYKGYFNRERSIKNNIVAGFHIEEFFSCYSSVFKKLPSSSNYQLSAGYSADWKEVSTKKKQEVGYICAGCKVNLESAKRLLHVHHINGNKQDNRDNNLVVLCADCHRKEPYHQHLFVRVDDTRTINRLRKEQRLAERAPWKKIISLADPAVHGVLYHCQTKGLPIPEVGYDIEDEEGRVVALELAWPKRKLGVHIGKVLPVPGWQLFNLIEAMNYFSSN